MKNALIDFAHQAGKLKRLVRTGWTHHDVPEPESVAEHSWRMALLAMVLAPQYGADPGRAVQMAVVHDLGEIRIGDLVTDRGKHEVLDRASKVEQERLALLNLLRESDQTQLISWFDEFEAQETPEAKLVKDLDKLEMALQALEYEQMYNLTLPEFFVNARKYMTNPELIKWLDELEADRH